MTSQHGVFGPCLQRPRPTAAIFFFFFFQTKESPRFTTVAPHSLPVGAILEKPGGWEKFQGLLQALSATGRGVETAMVQLFVDAGMHVVVETELKGPPPFELGGAPLSEEQTAAVVAAMSA